jgi:lipoprotein-anchoring transpeptidase ErfK/SrfK
VVDLAEQTLSVFRGPNEIGTTVLLYGTDQTPTPTGRFTVLAMDKDHWSSTYDAPMPYTLRLTSDGVSIHGSLVRPRAGTHGCLGVPIDFAKRLFAVAKVGDEVLITRNATSSAQSV